jgi:hypothetical protein
MHRRRPIQRWRDWSIQTHWTIRFSPGDPTEKSSRFVVL